MSCESEERREEENPRLTAWTGNEGYFILVWPWLLLLLLLVLEKCSS